LSSTKIKMYNQYDILSYRMVSQLRLWL